MKFLKITPEILGQGKRYGFNIFIYNIKSEIRYPVLYLGEELKEAVLKNISEQVLNGDVLQGLIADKEKIVKETNVSSFELDKLNEFNSKLLRRQITRLKENLGKHKSEYSYMECIEEVDRKKNPKPLTTKVKAEILCYPLYLSQNVSTATGIIEYLSESEQDILLCVCIAFVLAKKSGIEEVEKLCELIIVASIVDLGDLIDCNEKDGQNCKRLAANTLFIAKQAGLNLGKECKRYLIDYHHLKANSKNMKESLLVSGLIFTAKKIFFDFSSNGCSLKDSFDKNQL